MTTILIATRKAIGTDADLLQPGERERIVAACDALDEAALGEDPSKVHSRIEALDDATKAFAGRRMNRAIAHAIEGRRIDAIEKSVEHAKGIEAAHASGEVR